MRHIGFVLKRTVLFFFIFIYALSLGLNNKALSAKSVATSPEMDSDREVKAAVMINAFVPSRVSEVYSTVELIGSDEILADGQQAAVVKVTFKDKETMAPLKDISLKLSSNRGDIDKTEPKLTTSDENGQAIFTVKSEIAGLSTISAIADTYVVLNNKVTIKWKPLPVHTPATIVIAIPNILKPIFGTNKITLLEAPGPESLPLVDTTREFIVPFWIILILAIFFLVLLFLLAYLIYLMRKIRNYEKKELAECIQKEDKILAKEDKLLESLDQNNDGNDSSEIIPKQN